MEAGSLFLNCFEKLGSPVLNPDAGFAYLVRGRIRYLHGIPRVLMVHNDAAHITWHVDYIQQYRIAWHEIV